MRKIVLWSAVAVIAGGALYYGLSVYPSHQFRAGLDQAIAKLPPGYAVTYGGARYSLLTRRAELTDVTIHATGPVPFDVTIGGINVHRPNLELRDSWNRATANPAALQPDQALPVADRIEIRNVNFHNAVASSTLEAGSADKPRVYPWALLHAGLPRLSDVQTTLTAAMGLQAKLRQEQMEQARSPQDVMALEQAELNGLLPLIRLEAALVLGSGIDGYDLTNMTTSVAQAGGVTGANEARITIGKLHGTRFDRGLGGDNVMEALTEDFGPTMKISVDRASQAGLAFREPAMRLLVGTPLSLATLDGFALGRLEFKGMNLTLPTGGQSRVQDFHMSDLAFEHGALKSAGFGMSGFKLTAAQMANANAQQFFRQYGIDAMTSSLSAAYQWDADKKIGSFHDVSFKIDELGALSATARLANVGPSGGAAFAGANLIDGTIRYDDASLIDRALGAGGKRNPAQIEQMRQMFAAGLLQRIGQFQDDPKVAASAKAISAFADTPHSLTITLAPPAPVALSDLKTIGATGLPNLINVLGLSAQANQ